MKAKRAAQRGRVTCPRSHSLTLKGEEVRCLPWVVGQGDGHLSVSICKGLGLRQALCLGEEE